MTKPIDPFTRLPWRMVDDDRFASVYEDDSAFALYCRLKMAADMAWPASAPLPFGAKKAVLKRLADAGVVSLLAANRYRCPDLDEDRTRRQRGTGQDPDGDPEGDQPEPDEEPDRNLPGPSHTRASGAHDATEPAEPADETRASRPTARGPDAFEVYQQVTGSWPTKPAVIQWLSSLVDEHDEAEVCDALVLVAGQDPTRTTLLGRVRDHLASEAHRRSKEAEESRQREEAEYQRRERERVESMSAEERAATEARWKALKPQLGGLVKGMS